jgi:hypothetical protein
VVLVGAARGAAGGPPTVTVLQTFAGLNADASGGYDPPDVQVAAGPGFVVQMVNLAMRTWRTDGGAAQQVQTQTLATFFGTGSARLTDPRLLYDASTSRWFATVSTIDGASVMLAVSSTSDPTGAWSFHSFAASACADQPRLGIADGIVVIGADVFQSCDERNVPSLGAQLWVVNKQQLLAGAADVAWTTYGPDTTFSALTPVRSLSETGTEYVVSDDNPASRTVQLLAVDGIPPAAVSVRQVASLPVSPLSPPPPAEQPPAADGTQPTITANDDRVLDAVWENGKLWLTANTGCMPAGDVVLRSCARVMELSTRTRSVTWENDLGRPNESLFFAAISPDSTGDLVIVAGESGQSVLPELVVLARTPDGTFSEPVVIAKSVAAQTGDRYGDYFGAARDPLHPERVWVSGQHGTDNADGTGWATSVAAVQVVRAGIATPQAVATAPPGVRAQRVVAAAGSAVRLPYRMLGDGTGIRGQVTIRAAGRVVYRATASPRSVRAQQVYVARWRPAKKLRGRFTWCVRSLAADGTPSPQSCAALTLR